MKSLFLSVMTGVYEDKHLLIVVLISCREVPTAKVSAEDKGELIKQSAQHIGTVSQERQQPILGYVKYDFAGK